MVALSKWTRFLARRYPPGMSAALILPAAGTLVLGILPSWGSGVRGAFAELFDGKPSMRSAGRYQINSPR